MVLTELDLFLAIGYAALVVVSAVANCRYRDQALRSSNPPRDPTEWVERVRRHPSDVIRISFSEARQHIRTLVHPQPDLVCPQFRGVG